MSMVNIDIPDHELLKLTYLSFKLDVFEGYNAKTQHPMYMTSSMEYG